MNVEKFLEFMASPWGIVIFTVVALAIIIFFLAVNYRYFTKAFLDILFGLIALIVLSPAIGVCAVILKRRTGKVFERLWIIGKGGKPVSVRVFAGFAQDDGRECYISRSRIKYFPLVLEVISLKLSVIGPAPLSLKDGALIDEEFEQRFAVRPGVFSAAAAQFHSRPSYEEMFAADCEYVKRRSLVRDTRAMLVIMFRALRGEGYGVLSLGRDGYAEKLLSDGQITSEQYAEAEKIAEEELAAFHRSALRVG